MTRRRAERVVALAAALALALAFAGPATAQVYKWVDSAGKVHYGDKPPEDAKKQELKLQVQSFSGPPQTDNWREILRRAPQAESLKPKSAGLTMYSAAWCGYCRQAKAYMAEKGISYREVDIESSEEARAEFKGYGGGGVPLFIVGDHRMRGFRPSSLEALLAKSRG